MRIRFVKSLAVAFAMLVGGTAIAQDYYAGCDTDCETVSAETSIEQVSFMGGGYDDGCDSGCGIMDGIGNRVGGGGAYVDLELLVLQAGVGTYTYQGTNEDADNACFQWDIAPRVSVGYVGCGGLGIRVRYFDFSHTAGPAAKDFDHYADENILADTYNLDLEFFEEIEIGCATSVEWSAGFRYNDFRLRDTFIVDEDFGIQTDERFSGFGLIFGLQVNRCLGPGNIYARARWAILHADSSSDTAYFVSPNGARQQFDRSDMCDEFRMQTEIALGYEVSRCTNLGVVTGRLGYEMQYWDGYAHNRVGRGDFGLHGLVLGLELAR